MGRAAFLLLAAVGVLAANPKTPAAAANRNIAIPVSLPPGEAPALADFSVRLDTGAPARVLRASGGRDELLLLLVMDVVSDLALAEPARQALAASLESLPASTQVAVLRAQDGLQVVQDPTADRAAATTAINSLAVTGRAGLLDTIETVVQLADSIAAKSAVRVGVLYVSDSDVRNYREDYSNPVINSSDSRDLSRRFPEGLIREKISKTIGRLTAFQTPVSIVHLRYASERLNEAYQSGLMQITSALGGDAAFCRSTAEIPQAIENTVRSVQSQGSVVVQIPAKTAKAVQLSVLYRDQPVGRRNRWILK